MALKLLLDTSTLLAASGSTTGASSEIFRLARPNNWSLLATPYIVEEVLRNLPELPIRASADWLQLRRELILVDDVLTIDWPVLFPIPKDRPILFSALAWADVLLTHDRNDFAKLLGREFYGLTVLTPGAFLHRERAAGRLKI
jgi:predicted nucleic acid-binding protein